MKIDITTPAERLACVDALIAALSAEREVLCGEIVKAASTETAPPIPTEAAPAAQADTAPGTGTAVIKNVDHTLQADEHWADLFMGEIGYEGCKIRSGGCALSALSALAAYHLQRAVTPITLNRFLQENDGYRDGALVVWGALSALLKKYGVEAPHRSVSAKKVGVRGVYEAVREQIDQDNPAVLRMRGERGPHFLLAIGYSEDDIITHDPGTWRGNGYGDPPCSLKNPTRSLSLEGAEIYGVSGTPQGVA